LIPHPHAGIPSQYESQMANYSMAAAASFNGMRPQIYQGSQGAPAGFPNPAYHPAPAGYYFPPGYMGMQTLMPHPQIPPNIRYAMPGQPMNPSPSPAPQLMYHPAGASPYGSAATIPQWQLAPAAAPSPAPPLVQSGGGSERATPNPAMMFSAEYHHLSQLQPGMIISSNAGPGSTPGYSPNNTIAAAPSPHPQLQQQQPQQQQ